jgi:hypothetical protein
MSKFILLGALNKITNQYVPPSKANKKDSYICLICKKDVILKQGNIRVFHFAHKKYEGCDIYSQESIKHKNAKIILKFILDNNIPFEIFRECYKCKNNIVIESSIHNSSFHTELEYEFEHESGKRRADIACIEEGSNDILFIFEICNTNPTSEDVRPEPWYEFDCNDVLNLLDCENKRLRCIRKIPCEMCENKILSEEIEDKKGIIYFNQRGAGCGKTYESIQLLQNPDFMNKKYFIYLTKMNSAVEVIYNEMNDQYINGKLQTLKRTYNNLFRKKYNVMFKRENKDYVNVIIGTIDSFSRALADQKNLTSHYDIFKSFILTIRDGKMDLDDEQKIMYANDRPVINDETLIIIDEAQDLDEIYIQAFETIIKRTNIDVYIIGDKLQSILNEENVYTYVEKLDQKDRIIKSDCKNIVMRFHNKNFVDFVNKIVPFENYNLIPVIGICNENCSYKHENDKIPYNIFFAPEIYSNDYDYKKIDKVIDYIIDCMDDEIKNYNYLPKNFMFIFPILSKNTFAKMIEIRIQKFWIEKFQDEEYKKILQKDSYWKDNIDNDKFRKYVYLHRSDEGSSINLKESEHSTRIVSIHTSKGNGCEVVFLFGLSENCLKIFSYGCKNLVYESLLHVALTRQKKSLYVGINNYNDDDICSRFLNFEVKNPFNLKPDISSLTKSNNDVDDIIKYIERNTDIFEKLKTYIDEYKIFPEEENKERNEIIDMGHHEIRKAMMNYMFIYTLGYDYKNNNNVQHNIDDMRSQIKTVFRKVCETEFFKCNYIDYNKQLRNIDDFNKLNRKKKCVECKKFKKCKRCESNNLCISCDVCKICIEKILEENKIESRIPNIPILFFDENKRSKYYKYAEILEKIILRIKRKFSEKKKGLYPQLCSLECMIFYFLINIRIEGSYSKITIMDVYSIMWCYDLCSESIDEEHEKFNCVCKAHFCEGDKYLTMDEKHQKIKNSITKHFEECRKMYKITEKFIEKTKSINMGILNYNMNHLSMIKDENFSISHKSEYISYSETHVINIILKPQFNKINFYETIIKSLLAKFLIANCSEDTENYKRYNDKQIYTCIISLDIQDPLFYILDLTQINDLIIEILGKFLKEKFSKNHISVFEYYERCKKSEERLGKSSFEYTYEKLEKEKCLKYIRKYFEYLACESLKIKDQKDELAKFIEYHSKNKETMVERLNEKLDEAINKFLNNYRPKEKIDF